MHSWTIVGAVLLCFFSSSSLALPLIPRVASDPSTSVVERRWNLARLLPRVSRPQQAPSIYDTVTTDFAVDPQTGESEVVSTQTTSTQSTVDPAAIAETNTTSNATSPDSVVSSENTGYKLRVSPNSPLAKLYGRAKLHLRALGKRQDPSLPDTTVQDYNTTISQLPPSDANTAASQDQKLCAGPFDDPFCNKLPTSEISAIGEATEYYNFFPFGGKNKATSRSGR
ncbi:MAG: hypothetical protein LQ337_006348 [Flavoplaca oasis]|nr:MAG: hypothetical protein LQ337_006348 [Flavoplaca oasis]